MGCTGGTLWYLARGIYNSPRKQRLRGGINFMKHRAPMLGGSFALWAGTFGTVECTLIALRRRDDPLNSIVSGFLTGGIMAMRSGFTATMRGALGGGLILGMIELVTKKMTDKQMQSMYSQAQHFEEYLELRDAEIAQFNKSKLPSPQQYMRMVQTTNTRVNLDEYKATQSLFASEGLDMPDFDTGFVTEEEVLEPTYGPSFGRPAH